MTIKHSRAQRRHDRARLKKKRRNHWGYGKQGWRSYCHIGINEMKPAQAGMVVNTPTPCSCDMCGNPRRNGWTDHPLTMQERKGWDAAFDGLEEYELWQDYHYDYDYYHSIGQFDHYDNYWWEGSEDDPANDWYLRWMYMKG